MKKIVACIIQCSHCQHRWLEFVDENLLEDLSQWQVQCAQCSAKEGFGLALSDFVVTVKEFEDGGFGGFMLLPDDPSRQLSATGETEQEVIDGIWQQFKDLSSERLEKLS